MFDIEYKGGNGVVFTTKKSKLVVDPKLSLIGLKDVSTKDAVAVATEERFAIGDEAALLAIEGPGEYEVSDFSIHGVAVQRHVDSSNDRPAGTIYRIEIGDVRIAVLGNIDPKLSEVQLEELGVVDIVIIPVGGNGYTLDATSATQLARQIDAKTVIPVHYHDEGIAYEVTQDDLDVFKKELGGEVEQTAKLKVKSAASLPSVLTIVELSRS